MFIFLLSVYITVSILLVLIVLLQMGRGAEMGAAFGNIGQGQTPHTPENFLGKVTTYVAVIFMLLSLGLAYLSTQNKSGSVLDSEEIIDFPVTQEKNINEESAGDSGATPEATDN